MRLPWRLWAVTLAAAGLVVRCAEADELIQTPVADRAEKDLLTYRFQLDSRQKGYASGVFPLGSAHELYLRHTDRIGGSSRLEVGGQWQLLPDGIVTPGLALGVWDLANHSNWGRRGFLALTKEVSRTRLTLPQPLRKLELTLGTGTGRFSGVFGGVRTSLPLGIQFVAEYDARRFNAGLWLEPIPQLQLKLETQNGQPFLGAQARIRF